MSFAPPTSTPDAAWSQAPPSSMSYVPTEAYSLDPTLLMGDASSTQGVTTSTEQQWDQRQGWAKLQAEHYAPSAEQSPPTSASFYSPASSASSYSGFFSPASVSSASSVASPPSSHLDSLLPSAELFGDATFTQSSNANSMFSEMQEDFLAHRPCEPSPEQQPTLVTHRYVPPPQTRHRSPAPRATSPSSPYSRASTPVSSHPYQMAPATYGSPNRRGSVAGAHPGPPSRRGSSSSLVSPDSPSRRSRRPSRLSIAVPPYSLPPPRSQSPLSPVSSLNAAAHANAMPASDAPLLPASNEDMDRLMHEITTILGPEVMASLDAPPAPVPSLSYPPHTPPPRRQSSYGHAGTMEMGGMTLSRQDLDFVDGPEDPYRQYPASAPAWQTTFNLPPSPHYQQQPQPQYYHGSPPQQPQFQRAYYSEQAYGAPPPLHYGYSYPSAGRPHSAQAQHPYPHLQDPRPHSPSPLSASVGSPTRHRRRRSSFDSPSAFAASSPAVAGPLSSSSPLTAPAAVISPNKAGAKASPKPRRRASAQTLSGGGGPKNIFINFTQSDSKKLLSGVAPSGSSKKKREEEEEAEKEKARLAAEA